MIWVNLPPHAVQLGRVMGQKKSEIVLDGAADMIARQLGFPGFAEKIDLHGAATALVDVAENPNCDSSLVVDAASGVAPAP